MFKAYVIITCAITLALSGLAFTKAETATHKAVTAVHKAEGTTHEVRHIVTKSAIGRVTTVGERCDLTRLLSRTVARYLRGAGGEVAAYEKSFASCLTNLETVKHIATEARKTP